MAGRDPSPSFDPSRRLPLAAPPPPEPLPVDLPEGLVAGILCSEARSTLTLTRVDGVASAPVMVEEAGCRLGGRASGRPYTAVVDDPGDATLAAFSRVTGDAARPLDGGDTPDLAARALRWAAPMASCMERWERESPGEGIAVVSRRWEARIDLALARIARRPGAPLPAPPLEDPDAASGSLERSTIEIRLHLRLRRAGRAVSVEASRWIDPALGPSAGSLDALDDLYPEALRAGAALFEAISPPALEGPVVFSPEAAGVLFHEICGHLLEGDLVAAGGSPFAGLAGTAIAPGCVTLHDDPLHPGARVRIPVDDEGEGTRPTLLIDAGRLAGYLTDRTSAAALGALSSGHARRESYRHPCLPRMTNLVLEPGIHDPADLLRGVGRGLFVERLGRGQVDPRMGRFRLEIESGRLVQDGAPGRSVAGGYLVGRCIDLLGAVDAVGADRRVDRSAGVCIKEDQIVPVGQVFPSLRVSRLKILPGAGP